MWPKILDLTQDECRGLLRRLELESYSNVIGAFRAQGNLNAVKLRILKDLREAFHISDDRHKAEVRRVVNDESLSTIAKMIYGPNTEVEWNREGSRGFLIINRKPSQTALSVVANSSSKLGEILNKQLKHPSVTDRDFALNLDNDVNTSSKIVLDDPSTILPKVKSEIDKVPAVPVVNVESNREEIISGPVKKRELIKHNAVVEIPKILSTQHVENKQIVLPKIESKPTIVSKPIAQTRRRKSTTVLVNHTAPKSMLLTHRRDTLIETNTKVREYQMMEQHHKPAQKPTFIETNVNSKGIKNNVDVEMSMNVPTHSQNAINQTISFEEGQVFEAVVPHNVDTIKGTRNVMNAISQGAQLVKVIDSKIIKKPVNISNMFITKATSGQPLKSPPMKPTFAPIKSTHVEYLTANENTRFPKPVKQHKIQIFSPDSPALINSVNVVQRVQNHRNDFISIPTARNPNIVKTSDKTIMHISPHLPIKSQIKSPIQSNAQNQMKYQQKQIVQVTPEQIQPRTVTIHPNSAIFKTSTQLSSINDRSNEYVHVHDWQNYDPRRIETQNGYVKIINSNKTSNNVHDYQMHASNLIADDIIYDDDIITEEYVASEEYSADNVIELCEK